MYLYLYLYHTLLVHVLKYFKFQLQESEEIELCQVFCQDSYHTACKTCSKTKMNATKHFNFG